MSLLDANARESSVAFSDFDEIVTWTPAGGSSTPLAGVFDRISEVTDIGEMIQMDGVAATLNVADSNAPAVARGDGIEARGISYKVVGVEPDGTGRTMLVLGI